MNTKPIPISQITRFVVKNLHGRKESSFDIKIEDNRVILVGENGAGKTTILTMIFYFLSGQWEALSRYEFSKLSVWLSGQRLDINRMDLAHFRSPLSPKLLKKHYSPGKRHQLEKAYGEYLATGMLDQELVTFYERHELPIQELLDGRSSDQNSEGTKSLNAIQNFISENFTPQILYLPTYRRIEQELSRIFRDVDEEEMRRRKRRPKRRIGRKRSNSVYVELVEFGMKDVQTAINNTSEELSVFTRENLNNLTFGYLGDIVEASYKTVDLDVIRQTSDEKIDRVLNRIPENTLSSERKKALKSIIQTTKTEKKQPNEQTRIICHYLAKLLEFQHELEGRELQINSFCRVCNQYMPTKLFNYDSSQFSFKISLREEEQSEGSKTTLSLRDLSSGEKQIVSLFSHLYLSGGNEYFVLIDEPELSLSVPWQRRFLQDISESKFCSGLVAVTHSPFIYDNALKGYAHGMGEFEAKS